MSNQRHVNVGRAPVSRSTDNPLAAVAGIAGFLAILFSFAASLLLGGFLVAFVILLIAIEAATKDKRDSVRAANVCLYGSAICLSFGTIPVFALHWLSYPFVGWVATALYLAALLMGLFTALSAFLRVFAALFAAVMIAGLVILPTPSSAFAGEDHSVDWSAKLVVRDANGNPIHLALGRCISVVSWFKSQSVRELMNGDGAFTDESGEAEFHFHEDPRLKVVLCMAFKPASFGMDVGPGYAPGLGGGVTPTALLSAPVEIRLTEPTPPHSNCDEVTAEKDADLAESERVCAKTRVDATFPGYIRTKD
jgi:hypothetical protein